VCRHEFKFGSLLEQRKKDSAMKKKTTTQEFCKIKLYSITEQQLLRSITKVVTYIKVHIQYIIIIAKTPAYKYIETSNTMKIF
jgi:hypothetical protein